MADSDNKGVIMVAVIAHFDDYNVITQAFLFDNLIQAKAELLRYEAILSKAGILLSKTTNMLKIINGCYVKILIPPFYGYNTSNFDIKALLEYAQERARDNSTNEYMGRKTKNGNINTGN